VAIKKPSYFDVIPVVLIEQWLLLLLRVFRSVKEKNWQLSSG